MQFPLDLCRATTCHRAQGETFTTCTVSVDLGLDNPDRQLPQDMSSMLHVACTRVPQLRHLFVRPIFPSIWEKMGNSVGDVERRKVDKKLVEGALEFASENDKYSEMVSELDWQPDYSNCEGEWKEVEGCNVELVVSERCQLSTELGLNMADFFSS